MLTSHLQSQQPQRLTMRCSERRCCPFRLSSRLLSDRLSHGLCSRRGSPGTSRAFASRRGAHGTGLHTAVAELGVVRRRYALSMNEAANPPPMDAAWAVCRSVPGLLLTAHLLLLLVLSRVSPSDAEAFFFLCLAWPILVPIALFFGIAALRYLIRAPGRQPTRRRYLIIATVSLIGTLVSLGLHLSLPHYPISATDDNTRNA